MVFEIKKMAQPEVLDLLRLSEHDYDTPLSNLIDVEMFSQKWSESAMFLLGYENGIRASAMAFYLNKDKGMIYITHFSVSRLFRHIGTGHLMMSYLINIYNNEFDYIELEAEKDSVAFHFYIREGFVCVEDRQRKYLMQKNI